MSYKTGIPGMPGVKSDGHGGLIVEGGVKDADGNPIGGAALPGLQDDGNTPPGVLIIGVIGSKSMDIPQSGPTLALSPELSTPLPAGYYEYVITWNNNYGESQWWDITAITVSANHAVLVSEPATPPDATFFTVYRGQKDAHGGPYYHEAGVTLGTAYRDMLGVLATDLAQPPTFDGTKSSADFGLTLVNALRSEQSVTEWGKSLVSVQPEITGNVTTGSLANLQSVVGQLLTALDAKGTLKKSTT